MQKPAHGCFLQITKPWKCLRRPSVAEWINNQWSIRTAEYYSALKRKELSSHEDTGEP